MFRSKKQKEDPKSLSSASAVTEKDISEWTVHDVGIWLASINLGKYRDVFFYNEIDGEMLVDIDDDDLLALPIERLGDRKKIIRRLNEYRGVSNASSQSGSQVSVGPSAATSNSQSNVDSYSDLDTVGAIAGSVSLKCVYNDDIRTLRVNKNDDYEAFKSKLKKEYGSSRYAAKFKDDDGDLITIRNNQDVSMVIQAACRTKVKLIVFSTRKNKGKGKSSSSSKKSSSSSRKSAADSDRGSESDGGSLSGVDAEAAIMENFVDSVIVINRRGVIQFFNGAAEDMFGWDREEVLGKNVSMLMNDDDAKNHNKYLRRYRREGKARVIGKGREVVARGMDGDEFKVWLSLSEANESYTGILRRIETGARSVSVNKAIVKSSVTHKFDVFDGYPKPVAVVNDVGMVQYINAKAETVFQHSKSNLEGHEISVLCPAIYSSAGEDLLRDYVVKVRDKKTKGKLLDANNERDVVCYTKSGSVLSFIVNFSHREVDGTTYYVLMFNTHVDNQDSAASTMLAAQRAVIANLVIPGIVLNENCLIQEMNHAAREMFGYSLSETLGRNVNMLIPPGEVLDNHTDWVTSYAKTGKGRRPDGTSDVVGRSREVLGMRKDGVNIKLNLSVTMLEEQSGAKIFTGILQLIGQVEKGVEDSAVLKQQKMVIDQLIIPSIVITHDSIVRAFNPQCQELFGFSEKEIVGKDIVLLIPLGEIRERHSGYVKNFALGKKKASQSLVVGKGRKVTARHKDGHNITVKLSVTERKDGPISIYTGTFT